VDVRSLRERADRLMVWGRETAMRMLDVVPGLQRFVNELLRVEVIDRSMVIAAQGLLALIPMLVVLGSFLPHDAAMALASRLEHASGVSMPDQVASLTGDQVRTQTGWLGLAITVFSATSFGRAVQRMHERVWDLRHIGGVRGARRCLGWLVSWVLLMQMVGLVSTFLGLGGAPRLLAQFVLGTLVWWWSARVLLLGREPWSRLLPAALVTSFGTVVYSAGSHVFMPPYARNSVAQLGTLGLVLAMTTWLIGLGFVLVVASVLGRVLVEDERIRAAVAPLLEIWPRRHGDGPRGVGVAEGTCSSEHADLAPGPDDE
jgi:membrane protein